MPCAAAEQRRLPCTRRFGARRPPSRRYSRDMSRRVLIADDSAVARVSVARRVRADGIEVEEQDSAAGASAVDTAELACALLDLELGDGLGTDVAERLRAGQGGLPIAF